MDKKSILKWIAAIFTWLFQSWGTPAFIAVTGIAMTWAFQTTEWVKSYGNVGMVISVLVAMLLAGLLAFMFQAIRRYSMNTKYHRRFLDKNPNINPLDVTFQNQRIYLSDFALPLWPFIDNKTFINCEIIGPANIYLLESEATHIPAPTLDAVRLDPSGRFMNGFTFRGCHLRGCSFHRITIFVQYADYENYKSSKPDLNWISVGTIEQGVLPLEQPSPIEEAKIDGPKESNDE